MKLQEVLNLYQKFYSEEAKRFYLSEELQEVYAKFLNGDAEIDNLGFLHVRMFGSFIKTNFRIEK
ncbi:MAG: hypothetical protein WAV31_04360 [Candidatus Moraniibacteriota bacterium]